MNIEIKEKLDDLYGRDIPQQVGIVVQDLLDAGFDKEIRSIPRVKTNTTVYSRANCPYVMVDVEPKSFPERRIPLVVDDFIYESKLKEINIHSGVADLNNGYKYSSLYRPLLNKQNKIKNVVNETVFGYILKTEPGYEVDHKYHSIYINTLEAIRVVTKQQNCMNKKRTKRECQPEFKYKPEEDFQDTWFVYVYWRMLGLISEKEAFAYNLEKNK